MAKATQVRVLNNLELTPSTPATITDVKALKRELKRIATRGYSTDNEEFLTGLIAVAVPIVDSHGKAFAAIACHAPVARLSLKDAISLVPVLKQGAVKLADSFAV